MDSDLLDELERQAFAYFLHQVNPANGLVADNTRPEAHSSIAAIGMGLAAYALGAERGFIERAEAVERTLQVLRFLWSSPQGDQPDATGYKGFYYHFLDMRTGRRAWRSELSMIDSSLLFAGMILAAQYFEHDTAPEHEVRTLADGLYRRADWRWAQNDQAPVSHGWKPECGFLNYGWQGYSEAIILYVLGLGSPTFTLPAESYRSWSCTYQWENLYGYDFLFASPLFIHQFSHLWIDFRDIQDEFLRGQGLDYFENSRRAVYVQQQYAMRNPRGFTGYHEHGWGITACDGPGPLIDWRDGVQRRFFDYVARGVPYGPDDGTLAPWSVAASLPFAPEIVLPTLEDFIQRYPELMGKYGLKGTVNPTLAWTSNAYYGIELGPMLLMIENHRSGFFWKWMRRSPPVISGLRRAGFENGWLS